MSAAVAYRPEIDGLRAIAVLAVVLFHARLGPFTGGYVGVDIFFVISGFLITSIIVREIESGAFSFAGFYERRIRRIFPALFVVIAATFVAGWFILTPKDYQDFARSAMHTTVFTSNFLFNNRAGYFAPAAETQPLLHTWSLAVEEQFYLIAPIALLCLHRLSARSRLILFSVLLLMSLAVAEYGVRREWPSAFYLLPARAWELMLGMALALGFLPAIASRGLSEIMGLAGLGLIASTIAGYTSQTPFPGVAAIIPCLGAALIICSTSTQPTAVRSLVSWSPVVGIGKISYSLYLWHWPLLAFATYGWDDEIGAIVRLGLIALAVLLSVLTYRYVEQPARQTITRRSLVFGAGGGAIAICAAAGTAIVVSHGAPIRLPQEALSFAAISTKLRTKEYCKRSLDQEDGAQTYCLIGDAHQENPSFVVWGDSHALAVGATLSKLAADQKQQGVFIVAGGCPPLLGLDKLASRRFGKCITSAETLKKVLARDSIHNVIVIARWGLYAEGSGGTNETNVHVRRFDETDIGRNRAEFARLLRQTVATLAESRTVTVFGPVPELPYDLPSEVIKDMMRGRTRDYSQPRAVFDTRQSAVLSVLADISKSAGVSVFYPHELLCGVDVCQMLEGGRALYVDDDHLSAAGAEKIAAQLRAALAPTDGTRDAAVSH